jgi:hypothetical protein
LTSAEICTDKKYRKLVVEFVDRGSGRGIVKLKKKKKTITEDSFEYASISNKIVRSSVNVRSIVHLKTLECQFSCLKGRTTHMCKFDPKQ